MKKIVALVMALALALSLCACGGSGGSGKDVDLAAAAQELLDSGAFTDLLNPPPEGVGARLYGFDEADVADYVIYTGTGATAEEIFLAKCADSAAASRVEELCRTRAANQRTAFESYVPEELPKLDSAVLTVSGNYVFFVVSNDAAAVRTIVDGLAG